MKPPETLKSRSAFVTAWGPTLTREAQLTLGGKQPTPTSAEVTLPPIHPAAGPSPRARGHPRSKVAGRQDGAAACPPAAGEGSPRVCDSLPWPACGLESPKMVFTTQLAAINYSRPGFPQTHSLSLLARSFLGPAQQPRSLSKDPQSLPATRTAEGRRGRPRGTQGREGLPPACVTHVRLQGRRSDLRESNWKIGLRSSGPSARRGDDAPLFYEMLWAPQTQRSAQSSLVRGSQTRLPSSRSRTSGTGQGLRSREDHREHLSSGKLEAIFRNALPVSRGDGGEAI